ncbi:MAG: hypothetical protein LQ342_000497 [Letrouitia transgressa]|nr:MAG: hypothetical protein LQ342_000497 [Letrouitia transgressa]
MKTASFLTQSSPLSPDTFVYTILSIQGSLAFISSDDTLRILDQTSLQLISSSCSQEPQAGVTCLTRHGDRRLLTAGRDGLVRCWDQPSLHNILELHEPNKHPILSLAAHDTKVAAGTELSASEAAVVLWDLRSSKTPLLQYAESHSDDVSQLRFHHEKTSALLSGSTDGLVNVYETLVTDEDEAVIQVFNHGSSIAHAGFLQDDQIFALSNDEAFSVYTNQDPEISSTASPKPQDFGDLRSLLECDYIVDVVPSRCFNEATVGASSSTTRHLDLIPLRRTSQWSLDRSETIRLLDGHGEDIIRSFFVDDEEQTSVVFTAGEDGFIKAWRTPPEESGPDEKTHERRRRRKSLKNAEQSDSNRFKPY